MIDLSNEPAVYEKEIHYNEDRHEKIFLTVNTFRGTEYISLRKYYQDFDEEWKPSREGVTMPIDFNNSKNLFEALVEIISLAEAKDVLETHFKEVLDNIYR
mgnify:FL=1|tara:strand:+ start:248 stop:550 length:303 start_codon:yes stop_codon:yes gene_type:complete